MYAEYYGEIVAICAECISLALPIGVCFGLAGKACDLFLSLAFGKERVKL